MAVDLEELQGIRSAFKTAVQTARPVHVSPISCYSLHKCNLADIFLPCFFPPCCSSIGFLTVTESGLSRIWMILVAGSEMWCSHLNHIKMY